MLVLDLEFTEWDAVVQLGAKPLSPNTGSEEIVGLFSEIGIRRPSFVKCPEKVLFFGAN